MQQEPTTDLESSTEAAPADNTRRGVLLGVGLAGVAGVVAACGGSDDSSSSSGSGSGDSGSSAGTGGALAQTSEIQVGSGKIFKDQKVVVTQPEQGTYKAFSTRCPHAGCAVGSVSNNVITCPCHNSKFSATDGSVQSGPAKEGLTEKQITVSGTSITLA